MPLTIGITGCKEWSNYERWIKSGSPNVNVVMLKPGEGEASFVPHCDGVILTGGEDVHPSFYGKTEYVEQYKLTDCNPERDKFEFNVLKEAEDYKLPLLGICRGLQLANVYFKGTLIPDLPSIGKTTHSGGPNKDSFHGVNLTANSRLHHITGMEKGEINSHHHQSADTPGHGLIVTALSDDGVTEGMEKANKYATGFFMLVQWHPERMKDDNLFSWKLREAFLKACSEYNTYFGLNQAISTAP